MPWRASTQDGLFGEKLYLVVQMQGDASICQFFQQFKKIIEIKLLASSYSSSWKIIETK